MLFMKNYLPLLLMVCLFALPQITFAQNDYQVGEFYEGSIIKSDGTEEKGYVIFQNPLDRREKVVFYKDKNNRKTKKTYKPKHLKGYKVGALEFKVIKYNMLVMKVLIFGQIESKGRITVFNVCNSYDSQKGEYSCEMILQKGDETPVSSARFLRFAKKMSKYISDHKELSKKVKSKEKGYRLLNMMAIIAEYNEWYEANNE